MSWSAFVLPLHACPPDLLDWVRGFAPTALPEGLPQPEPLPTVEQVLVGLRDAGCSGDAWYTIADDEDRILPGYGDPEGLYVGEVSITVDGAVGLRVPIHRDDRVTSVCFRKPRAGLRRAAMVLAALGGDQLVFDDTCGDALVVRPDDTEDALAARWPW